MKYFNILIFVLIFWALMSGANAFAALQPIPFGVQPDVAGNVNSDDTKDKAEQNINILSSEESPESQLNENRAETINTSLSANKNLLYLIFFLAFLLVILIFALLKMRKIIN